MMIKNVFSIILSIIICALLHFSDPGNGKFGAQEFIGFFFVFVVGFFISRWIFDKLKIVDNSTIQNNERHFKKSVQNDLLIYEEAKNSYQYFSNEKLLILQNGESEFKLSNMEKLALEEILVERGLLDHSPIREKMYDLKKHFNL